MTAAIYQILNRITGDRYIGGCSYADKTIYLLPKLFNCLDRPDQIPPEFRLESKLSEDWFDYGEESFSISLVEKLTKNKAVINSRRVFWCRSIQPSYNLAKYSPIVCGVYQIVSLKDGYSYIGQSRDICQRWYSHKIVLKLGRHNSKGLQACFNKYGEYNLELRFLEICLPDRQVLLAREMFWIHSTLNLLNVHCVTNQKPA